MPYQPKPPAHGPGYAPAGAGRKHRLLAGLLLVMLVIFAYQDAPRNGFHLDDLNNILRHPPIWLEELSLKGLIQAGHGALLPTRPLPSVTFAIDWWRGVGDPAPFQWSNLILHSTVALALFGLLNSLLQRFVGHSDNRTLWCAFLGAAIWAVHPIQIQSVTYIVQRMNSMAALFTLLAVLSYVHGRLAQHHKPRWFLLCATSALCGAFSKENAWITPLLLLLAEYGVCRHGRPLIASRWDYFWLGLPIILGLYLFVDLISGTGPLANFILPGYAERDFTLKERLLTQPRVILFHFSQILWPLPSRFSIEHDFPLSAGLIHPASTLAAILALLGWIGAGIWLLLRRNQRLWGFLLLWVPTTLAIESSIVPLEMVFEHRMYLPTTGLAGLAALALAAGIQRQRLLILASGVAAIIMVACLASTLKRIPDWQTRLTLNEAILPDARSARVWATLALAYVEEGRPGHGLKAARQALALDPRQPQAMEALGIVLMDQGRLDEAERYFSRAYGLEELDSTDSLLNHWGELRVKRGDHRRALALFSQAIEEVPWVSAYHWNIALTLEQLNQCSEARIHWERYLELEADTQEHQAVHQHLDNVHKSPTGKCWALARTNN
jgi:Tfp pilus assembly protein PilF